MNNIKIFSDSTCDLPVEDVNRMDIGIVPLAITFDNEVYKEGIEITTSELFEKVRSKGILPKTSAPSPADFVQMFKPYVDNNQTILYIGLSSKISTTVQNARLAAKHLGEDKVKIVDSLNLCGGISALIRIAYNYLQTGMSLSEVIDKLEKIKLNYRLFFTIDKLDYLHMGGRCSSTTYIFGNALNIKPVILMSPNGLEVWKKTRGKKRAINLMIDDIVLNKDNILNDEIHIACAPGNEEELAWLKEHLKERTGITKFYEYKTGCVISSHCGEGTIGFGYFIK